MTDHDVAVVVRDNRYGLTRDAAILREGFESIGMEVGLFDKRELGFIDRLRRRKFAGTIIHLERVHPAWLGAAKNHVLIPNQERFPKRHIGRLKYVDRVLAKTRHAQDIFAQLGADSTYLGFTSPDRYDPSVSRDWDRFFHVAGGSTLKGTEDLLTLWRAHPEWPELVVVQKQANAPKTVPPNVTLICGYIDDNELMRLQNTCGIHLCPSRSEGWGHNIVEAMSCGTVVITTDAAPMNEHVTHDCGVLVRSGRSEPRHLGHKFFVDRQALEVALGHLVTEPLGFKRLLGVGARGRFEEINRRFAVQLRAVFGQVRAVGTPYRSHG